MRVTGTGKFGRDVTKVVLIEIIEQYQHNKNGV